MEWRTKPPVKRPGMIEPCIPTRTTKPPVGPQWIHEIKHDGYRLIARKEPSGAWNAPELVLRVLPPLDNDGTVRQDVAVVRKADPPSAGCRSFLVMAGGLRF